MIAHTILFQPRADLTPDEQRQVVAALQAGAAAIVGIRRFRIGRRVLHGLPGYEQAMRVHYEYLVLVELDDLDALKTYLAHPSHTALGRHFVESAAAALAYDYELVDVSEAAALLDG